MNKYTWSITALLCVLMVGILAYQSGYSEGKDIGKVEGKVEQELTDKLQIKQIQERYDALYSPDYQSHDEDYGIELIKGILDSAQSVKIDFEANRTGYNKGVISIYFGNNENK